MIITCPECGHQVSDQAKTCPSCGIEIAGKVTQNGQLRRPRKHRAGITALIVAFVIALIIVFLGFYFMRNQEQQNELRAYENAMRSSEPMVLQSFLDVYADAPKEHRDSIKIHLEAFKKIEADWSDALVNNTKFGFIRFLKLHPQSLYTIEANIKIDSLDWAKAITENTPEAFQSYLNEHADGAYYDEARAHFEQLEAQKLTPEDRQQVIQLFTTYFNAIAQKDENALSLTLEPVLRSFLHRPNATKDDVQQYMYKMHEEDITNMKFTPNNDWEIEKNDLGEGRYTYNVRFSVAQHIERTDEDRETSAVFRITAMVSPDGRISELNMKRSVQ
jgi:hypothetical protein